MEDYTVEQLKKLRSDVKHYLRFGHHMRMLKQTSWDIEEENHSPWYTLKEGSYYLGNVYPLMKTYMEYNPDKNYDKNMESVIDTMTALGFQPSYNTTGFTDEAYGEAVEVFVSKGQGTMYYKLLHSKYKKDIKFFVDLVERDIDIPIKQFLERINMEMQARGIAD